MKRALLFLALFAAFPLLAHEERKVILVLVDLKANRAYIPEGTVLPPLQFNVRMEKTRLDRETFMQLRGDRDGGKGRVRERGAALSARARLKARPPLQIEYAPAERFVAMRRGYEAQLARRPRVQTDSHQTCFDTYVSDTEAGVYNNYTNGFTSTFCQPSSGITVGVANNWEFRATADYSDDDQWINPYVWIDDQNGNFYCFDEMYYSGDLGQCSASASTVLLQQGCLNDVDTVGLQYYIEYLPGYVENYIGYNFVVDYCTYFY